MNGSGLSRSQERRLQRALQLAEIRQQMLEDAGEFRSTRFDPVEVFPVDVVDPPVDPDARARRLARSAEIRAGVRRYLDGEGWVRSPSQPI